MYKLKSGKVLPKEFKIKVTPDESKALQEYCLSIGIKSLDISHIISYLDYPYVYLRSKNTYLTGDNETIRCKEKFEKDPLPQIHFQDYFEKEFPEKWCIEVTEDNYKELDVWMHRNWKQYEAYSDRWKINSIDTGCYFHSIGETKGGWGGKFIKSDNYTLITTEQFRAQFGNLKVHDVEIISNYVEGMAKDLDNSIVKKMGKDKSIIDMLPKKTHNGETYGLTFQIDGSGEFWWCFYYSHFIKSTNGYIHKQKGNTIEESALNMYNFLQNKRSEILAKHKQVSDAMSNISKMGETKAQGTEAGEKKFVNFSYDQYSKSVLNTLGDQLDKMGIKTEPIQKAIQELQNSDFADVFKRMADDFQKRIINVSEILAQHKQVTDAMSNCAKVINNDIPKGWEQKDSAYWAKYYKEKSDRLRKEKFEMSQRFEKVIDSKNNEIKIINDERDQTVTNLRNEIKQLKNIIAENNVTISKQRQDIEFDSDRIKRLDGLRAKQKEEIEEMQTVISALDQYRSACVKYFESKK